MVPGIRCPIQGHQSGMERRCADLFKQSWKPRLEELYARQQGARKPPLSVPSAPSSPVSDDAPIPRQINGDGVGDVEDERSPLLPGRLAMPCSRWVVRSYSAVQSRDLLYTAGRIKALTASSTQGLETAWTDLEAALQVRQGLDPDLEAGGLREGDDKSGDIGSRVVGKWNCGVDPVGEEGWTCGVWQVCKWVLSVLLAVSYVFVIATRFRERYG